MFPKEESTYQHQLLSQSQVRNGLKKVDFMTRRSLVTWKE